MTDSEKEAADADLAAMREVVAHARDYVHEVDTLLRVFLGELELSVIRARKAIDAIYQKHPEVQ